MHSTYKSALLALAGWSVTIAASHGALISDSGIYNSGDLLLGFRADSGTGATKDYILDLGLASQFTPNTQTFTLALTNVSADLAATFGSNWATRSDLFWGIVGTDLAADPANTLYVSRPEDGLGPATAWARRTNSAQSTTNSTIRAFVSGYLNSDQNAASSVGTIQDTGFANSYAQFTASSTDFGVWSGVEGNFGSGSAGATLDLFRLTPTQQAAGNVYLGSFNINDSGQVSFTGAAVPEPASAVLLALGGAMTGMARLRRKTVEA